MTGPCDFFFALHPPSLLLESPIISIVEAKDEDLEWGIAQCAAQLYAAHLFNQKEDKNIPILYGCATTGIEWHFMKYEPHANTFSIDLKPITELPYIIGVWHTIIDFFIRNAKT